MEELVSIIVPVYNSESFLNQCINSIKSQTYSNIEIILIDDGSKDQSAQICQEFARLDSRMRYIYQDNGGVASARNNGLRHASGKFVLFVDSDDRIRPDMVDTMVRAMLEADSDLVVSGYAEEYADYQIIYEINQEVITGEAAIRNYYVDHFLQAIASSVWAKLYKRSLIQNDFHEDITMGEDFLFNIDYFSRINSLSAVSRPLYLYNKANENSLVRNYKESYFRQNLYVCQYADHWLTSSNNTGMSIVNIQTKIAYSFFEFFFYLVQNGNTVKVIKNRMSDVVDDAVKAALMKSADQVGSFRRIVAKLLLNKNYALAIIVTKMYLKLRG